MLAAASFEKTFRRIHGVAAHLVDRAVPRSENGLRAALLLALRDQSPTEYPYVFRNSFLGREPGRNVVDRLSEAVHLVQTSTFVLDDIFDRADRRNGNPSVAAHSGVDLAIMAAQTMQFVALSAMARTGGAARLSNVGAAVAALTDAVTSVYRGQSLDLSYSRRLRTSRTDYYRVIRLTTASLFRGTARCAALLAGRTPSEIRSLSTFATHYGMALQITDDILDITDEWTGKSPAADLKCRRMRLPLIIAMRNASSADRAALRRFMTGTGTDKRSITAAAAIVRRSRGISGALTIAKGYCARSLAALQSLGPSTQKNALVWMADSLLTAQGLDA